MDCFHLHATIFEVIGRNLRASERASESRARGSEAKKRFLQSRQAKIKSTCKPTGRVIRAQRVAIAVLAFNAVDILIKSIIYVDLARNVPI